MRIAPLVLLAVLPACLLSRHPEVSAPVAKSSAVSSWEERFTTPGVIEVESVLSARWSVPLKGLVNLNHEAARAASLENVQVDIVLPVHVLRHPTQGFFVIDTGVGRDRAAGGRGPERGLIRSFTKSMQPNDPLGDVLARQEGELAGVFLTHLHLDHVLGLPDVPAGTPIYAGPGELDGRVVTNAFLRGTYRRILEGQDPLHIWDFAAAPAMGPVPHAIDVVGDGSIWALSSPGHTPGSTAYLANTKEGPMLFVGDTCHTRWGWANGVEPGTYTEDQQRNATSLAQLHQLAEKIGAKVYMGHELDGEGTGVVVPEAR